MAIREGAWDCAYCGRKRNRGPHRHCAGCGVTRGRDVEFYLPEDAAEVTDAAGLAAATAGADWTCGSCAGDNRAGDGFCGNCGAPRDGGAARPVYDVPIADAGLPAGRPASGAARMGGRPPRFTPYTSNGVSRVASWTQERAAGPSVLTRLLCAVAACAVLALFLLPAVSSRAGSDSRSWSEVSQAGGFPEFAAPRTPPEPPDHDENYTVTAAHWERIRLVYGPVTRTREDWEGQVPAGARELSRSQQIHHYDKVQTGSRTRTRTHTERVQVGTERTSHTERVKTGTRRVKTGTRNLGNGYFQDVYKNEPVYGNKTVYSTKPRYENRTRTETYQEPVYEQQPRYRTKIRYEIDEVVEVRRETAAGAAPAEPRWPAVELRAGELRVANGPEAYMIDLIGESGARHTRAFESLAEWLDYRPGAACTARVTYTGRIRSLALAPVAPPATAPAPASAPAPVEAGAVDEPPRAE
ncbi:MAG: hypothetical protein HZA54_13865 [Planctomycetes bacterium]|nr:hypothetical protein [Planctomycetota bacterium]